VNTPSTPGTPTNLKPSETVEDGFGDTGVGEVLVGASAKAMARAGVGANCPNGDVKEGGEVPWRVSVGNGCQDLLNKVGNGMYVGRGAGVN
jgi:hypothetical protein